MPQITVMKDRSIISTYQVEMEFKKNRQAVIQKTLENIKFDSQISLPAVFHDSATSKSLDKIKKDAKDKLAVVEKRFVKLLQSPKSNDIVFKTLEDIFHNPSDRSRTVKRGFGKKI